MIYITGEINAEAFVEFDKKLPSSSNRIEMKAFNITLMSEGGCAKVAMAFFDRIRSCAAPTYITVTGSAESAAVLILAAGTIRRMTKNAWVMVHEDSVEGIEGARVTQIEKDAKHFRRLEDQWCHLLASVTKTSAEDWARLHRDETYLSAEECLQLGLIDEII